MSLSGFWQVATYIALAVILALELRLLLRVLVWYAHWRRPGERHASSRYGVSEVPRTDPRGWVGLAVVLLICGVFGYTPWVESTADAVAVILSLFTAGGAVLLSWDGWRMALSELSLIHHVRRLCRLTRRLLEQHHVRERLLYPRDGEPSGSLDELDRLLARLEAQPWSRETSSQSWQLVKLLEPAVEQMDVTVRLVRYRYRIRDLELGAHVWPYSNG